jgi:ubiquitin carboxyl-terminal hydrolase 5/13
VQPEEGRAQGQGQGQGQQAAAAPAAPAAAAAAAGPDPGLVAQLVSMGFSENGSKRAVMATGNNSAEAAMEWVFGHLEDAGGWRSRWAAAPWPAPPLGQSTLLASPA